MAECDELVEEFAGMSVDEPLVEESPGVIECHARIIAFFAHKGGVSKTTNVFHTGYALAQDCGLRVLLVDADPQTNLSQMCCAKARTDAHWRDGVERGDVYSGVRDVHMGLKTGSYMAAADCVRVHKKRLRKGELWLLPGSLRLARLEPQITFAHNLSNPHIFPLFDDVCGAFRALLLATCAHYRVDVCLVDMGPSIGELNKSLFWAADYFAIPVSADSFSKTTLQTMAATLPRWCAQQRRLADITAFQCMPLNPAPPKFVGVVMSMFQVSGSSKAPVKEARHWMDLIYAALASELLPVLRECRMLVDSSGLRAAHYRLAEIPHFLSLCPLAHRNFAAVFDIPQSGFCNQNEDGELKAMSKTEIKRHKERAAFFHKRYVALCKVLVDAWNTEEGLLLFDADAEGVENVEPTKGGLAAEHSLVTALR